MIEVEGLRLSLGGKPIFEDVSFRISLGTRICLAGRNGQGKSTLMKVVLGQVGVEAGRVSIGKGFRIGYLPQDIASGVEGRIVVKEVLDAIPDLERLEREIEDLANEISLHPEDASILDRFGKAQAAFDALDGYTLEAKACGILDGLGFSQERMNANMATLSGGWQMRVHLAKLLLTRPDALILDEPTNHLDLESREWLLDFLKTYEGTLIITSHDRYFLDHLVKKVYELEAGKLTVYHGNYTRYEEQRDERIAQLKVAHSRQKRDLKRQQEFIERNRAKAATASNVQSRIKQLAKIERIVLPWEPPPIKLRFPEPRGGGHLAFRTEGLGKSYGETKVFSGLDIEVPVGEKLAVVGINGAGKTTFLRLLAQRLEPTAGTMTLGHEVTIQYFSQYEDHLPEENYTLLQAMEEAAPPESKVDRRSVLGSFLFTGDDVHKPISVLSGGERARLKLARMLLAPSNLLVMDEPTNHLDLHSKEVLFGALNAFKGSVIFVSHDRGFLSRLATSVLELRGGGARFFPTNYENYRWRLLQDRKEAAEAQKKPQKKGPPASKASKPAPTRGKDTKIQRKRDRQAERDGRKELKRLKRKAQEAQELVETKEKRVTELEVLMNEPTFFDDNARSQPVVIEHRHLQAEVEVAYEAFEAALARVEAAEA
ncbi:MAG: ATP-binding cassette domain-containing protein [Planctomycetes bacterium]|nr:ATP-binding cassette domain-containing protein [Planctomycetota bacterium]